MALTEKSQAPCEGGDSVFIAYAAKDLRLTFEYGPEPGMIALRNCGPHDVCERRI
jgi:hypothetical protein